MKKSTLSISIDNEKFQEITDTAAAMHMKRSTYVETLIDRARNTNIPLEILLLNQYFDTSKKANLSTDVKEALDEPIKQLLEILSEGVNYNGKIQGSKKK